MKKKGLFMWYHHLSNEGLRTREQETKNAGLGLSVKRNLKHCKEPAALGACHKGLGKHIASADLTE